MRGEIFMKRPECGSIEMNRMIKAINAGEKENPCKGNKRCEEFWNSTIAQADRCEKEYGERPVFALCEPDEYEDMLLDSLIDDEIEAIIQGKKTDKDE